MICAIASFALLTSVAAYRVEVKELEHSEGKRIFENCEDFRELFHGRVSAVQNFLDAHPNATGFSKMDQARFTMKTFAVVRTLRRAKDCEWVVNGNSEEIQAAQNIVRVTLAGNPCAAAAMAELTPEAYQTAAHELIPLQRAMMVLVSDACVVPELVELDFENEEGVKEGAQESEEQMANTIDELFEEAAIESEGGTEGSLMQSQFLGRVFAWIGAIFFAIVYGFFCAGPGAVIGLILGVYAAGLYCACCGRGPCQEGFGFMFLGMGAGGLFGFAQCAATQIMPLIGMDATSA